MLAYWRVQVGVYVHEDQAAQVLGPRFGGRPVKDVLDEPGYVHSCLAAAPFISMTVWMRATRELPLAATLE